jgi:uncharacterized protein
MKPHFAYLAAVPATAWKNGGGVTHELLAWPPGAGNSWLVRVSVATIAGDGPFSRFPGVQRWFAVLEGDGVALEHTAAVVECRPGHTPWTFEGSDAPMCRLLGSATRDLNLMLRDHGAMRRCADQPQLGGSWRWRALFTHEAATLLVDGAPHALPPDTLAWSDDPTPSTWSLAHATAQAYWLTLD